MSGRHGVLGMNVVVLVVFQIPSPPFDVGVVVCGLCFLAKAPTRLLVDVENDMRG